jgi:hypothetical protein
MKDNERRERQTEQSMARMSAVSDGATLSVAAGSMMLGAALSEPAMARQQSSGREMNTPDRTIVPDQNGQPSAHEHTSGDTASASATVATGHQTNALGTADHDLHSTETAVATGAVAQHQPSPQHNASHDTVTSVGSTTATAQGPDLAPLSVTSPTGNVETGQQSITGGIVAELSDDLASVLHDLHEVASDLSAILQTELPDSINQIGDLLAAIPDVASAQLPGLEAIEAISETALAPALSWTAIDGAAQASASVLNELLGAHSGPQADGIVAETFGAPGESMTFDAPAFTAETAIVPAIGFIGQSYADIIDPHDIGSHSIHATGHGPI